MATRYGRMVTYLDKFLPKKSHDSFITWSCEITWQRNHFISTIRVFMATKLGKMVTYHDRLVPIKSQQPLTTWSSKITWQTKIFISPLAQCLWPPNLPGWQPALTGCCLYSHMTLWSSCPVRSHEKLKLLYIPCISTISPLSECLCPTNLTGW